MTTELSMLTASALLALAQAFPQFFAVVRAGGLAVAGGNRDDVPPLPAWARRAERAQLNMLANFVPFAALVLAAHAADLLNAETAFGATLFFWARLAYAVVYIAGIPYVRAVAFVASLAGLFDVAGVLLEA